MKNPPDSLPATLACGLALALALGLVEASEAQRNAARRRAFIVSRLNLVLSFPLLFFMGAAGHPAVYF